MKEGYPRHPFELVRTFRTTDPDYQQERDEFLGQIPFGFTIPTEIVDIFDGTNWVPEIEVITFVEDPSILVATATTN